MFQIHVYNSSDILVAVLDRDECDATIFREINAGWSINVVYPIPVLDTYADKSAYFLASGAYLKVVNLDDSTDLETFIVEKTSFSDGQDGTLLLTVDGRHKSLVELGSIVINKMYDFQNVTPTFILTTILAYTSYTVGTVTTTAVVNLQIGNETALAALQKLLEITGGEYEVTTALVVNLLSALGTVTNPTKFIHVKRNRNLKFLQQMKYNGGVLNKVFGVGGGEPPATLAGTRHKIGGVSGANNEIIALTHNKFATENDSWNGYFIRMVNGAEADTAFEIVDCTHTATVDTITIVRSGGWGAAFAGVADDQFILEDDAGNQVDYILSTASIAALGTREGVARNTRYTGVYNLIKTSDLSGAYGSGLCADWDKEDTPTVTENTDTDFIINGTKSQKVVVAALPANPQGVSQTVTTVVGKMYKITAWVYVTLGNIYLQVGSYVGDSETVTEAGWKKFEFVGQAAGTTAKISILSSGYDGVTTFYLDSMLVVEDADEAENTSFTVFHDLVDLWKETFDYIYSKKDIQIEYTCNFIDLQKISQNDYPYEEINLGDVLLITDENLDVDQLTARVMEMNYKIFQPELTEFTVNNYTVV